MNASTVVFWIVAVAAICGVVIAIGLVGIVLAAGQDLPTEERD